MEKVICSKEGKDVKDASRVGQNLHRRQVYEAKLDCYRLDL